MGEMKVGTARSKSWGLGIVRKSYKENIYGVTSHLRNMD